MNSEQGHIGVAVERFDQLVCSQCECPIDIRELAPFTRIECPQCRHPATVPAKLGQFILLDLIGTGGMGSVYVAEDEALGRLVAIKVMQESLGQNTESVEKFRLEAQAAARLNHPNIAQIYSIGQERGQPYIVMELVNGHGLDSYIAQGKPVNQGLAVKIGLDIALALKAADETGLLHGDIKPENILIDEKGRTKLVDFGLASLANQAAGEGIWGTPYYIAPEKVRRQKVDLRSDIYSLGATLYHAIASKPPFDGETPADVVKARLDAQPPPLSSVCAGVHPQVESVITRMLQTDPLLRYPTYASLISDFRRVLEVLPRSDRSARLKLRATTAQPATAHLPRVTQHIDEAGGEQAGTRPRIIIKAAKPRLSAPDMATKAARIEMMDAERTQREASRRRRRRRVLWMLLLLAAAGCGAGLTYLQRQRDTRMVAGRRAQFALREQRAACTNTCAQITNSVGRIEGLSTEAATWVASASNALFVVLDQPPDAATWEALRVEAAAAPPVSTNGPAAVTNLPAAGASADDAPVSELDIRGLAIRILAAQPAIAKAGEKGRSLGEEAVALLATAEAAGTVAEAAEAAGTMSNLLGSVRAVLTDASAQGARMKAAAERAVKLKGEAEAGRDAQKRQEEDAARRLAEDEAQKQKEAELEALVQGERDQAGSTRTDCATLVAEYRFKEASEAARTAMRACKTDGGKAAFQVLVDRYQYLQRLKDFIAERLNKEPRPWIWGTGATAKDVVSADDKTIRYKGGEAAWKDVSVGQMLKFVNTYTASDRIRLRDQCTNLLAASIYCYEFGGGQGSAAA